MTTLYYTEDELLVIALNRSAYFFNANDLVFCKEIKLPEKLDLPSLAGADGKDKDDQAEEEKQNKEKSSIVLNESPTIQQLCYSPNQQFIAIATSGQKSLLLYRCRPEHAWLVSTRHLARISSAMTFSNDSESVLVVDKTGDCYIYDCVNFEAPPRLLLGHLSIVYDIFWSKDMKRIITCDRDDKIRVTNYPETNDIHGYCLGHKEFVAGLKWIENNTIASISGDKTLRLWNYENCKELAKIELPGPAFKFDIRKFKFDNTKYEVAVLHPLDDCVSMFEITKSENENWTIGEITIHRLDDINACNICFGAGRLYVTGSVNEKFTLRLVPISSAVPPPKNWLEMVHIQFQEDNWVPEDITTWFKKRYDNISDYMERKKRRIEEKQK